MVRVRPPFVAGNWKMNKDFGTAIATAEEVARHLAAEVRSGQVEAGLFPPALFLAGVAAAVRGTPIVTGTQDMHWEASGAFTGEVSGPMIRSVGGSAVIIGHSERRQMFGETDDRVRRKLHAALGFGLRPIVCVGETLEARNAGKTADVVLGQVDAFCGGILPENCAQFDVAYEPVWAIGTGRNATPEQATEVHALIRGRLGARFGDDGRNVRILYGGSVNVKNIASLVASPDIDGALVGGASLEAASFVELLALTAETKNRTAG